MRHHLHKYKTIKHKNHHENCHLWLVEDKIDPKYLIYTRKFLGHALFYIAGSELETKFEYFACVWDIIVNELHLNWVVSIQDDVICRLLLYDQIDLAVKYTRKIFQILKQENSLELETSTLIVHVMIYLCSTEFSRNHKQKQMRYFMKNLDLKQLGVF